MKWPILVILGLCTMQFLADFSGNLNIVHGYGVPMLSELKIPYEIRVSSFEYSPGTTITSKQKAKSVVNSEVFRFYTHLFYHSVKIFGNGKPFRDFFAYGVDDQTRDKIGSWQTGPQTFTFEKGTKIGNLNRQVKHFVELKWNSPSEGNGKVVFSSV